jgi:hypothetical protein
MRTDDKNESKAYYHHRKKAENKPKKTFIEEFHLIEDTGDSIAK